MKKIKQLVTMMILSSVVMTSSLSASAMVSNINPNIKSGDKVVNSIKEEVNKPITCIDFKSIASKYIGECPVTVMDGSTKDLMYMKPGNVIAVRLAEAPSTGYTWSYTIDNKEVIDFSLDGKDNLTPNKDKNAPQLVGSPYNHYWGFKAKKEGTATIKFKLSREWDSNEKDPQVFEYKISVVPQNSKINPYTDNEKDVNNDIKDKIETKSLIVLKEKVVNNSKLNETVSIKLEENPSTGYTWNYEISGKDAAKLISDNSVYLGKEGVKGAPINRTLNFKILKKGTTKITFKYYRSWEGKQKAIKTIEYKINVK